MISKIISGGQDGVEQAALDIAIKLGLYCGGWTPRETGVEHQQKLRRYNLEETAAVGFQHAVEKNVGLADGVLLISRGDRTQKSRYAVEMALKHQRQLLHVDLRQYSPFEAASLISSWQAMQKIKTVYVIGPCAQEDGSIYAHTQKILETAFYLDFVKTGLHPEFRDISLDPAVKDLRLHPQTVSDAVERLKSILSLKDRALLANLQPNELERLRGSLGDYIKQNFGLYTGNEKLLQSCAEVGGLIRPLADEAASVILRSLWQDLQRTHKLRIIK